MSKADEIKEMQKDAVIQFCTADRLGMRTEWVAKRRTISYE